MVGLLVLIFWLAASLVLEDHTMELHQYLSSVDETLKRTKTVACLIDGEKTWGQGIGEDELKARN